MIPRVLAVLTAIALVAGCTASGSVGSAAPTTPAVGSFSPSRGQNDTAPVDTGPTRAATATSCPFATENFVRDTMGMRLGRITVLRSGGRVVGCRFYALQNSPLHTSEHLPGPHQPVVEISTARFRTAVAAHNAFVQLGTSGRNVQRADLGRTDGICFQAPFYPKDHGNDWACAAGVRRTEVVVRSVDTTGSFSTAELTKVVLRHV